MDQEPRIACCGVVTFQDAYKAFGKVLCDHRYDSLAYGDLTDKLNGYQWGGTTLHCILQYPRSKYPPNGRWLIHPSMDLARALPLQWLYRASLQRRSPYPNSQRSPPPSGYDGRHRTPSISSDSSGSVGSLTPSTASFGSSGGTEYYYSIQAHFNNRISSATIDASTGDVVSLSSIANYGSDLPPSHLKEISWLDPALDRPNVSHPRYNVPVEHRSIMIRELNWNVTKPALEDFLRSLHLRGECQFPNVSRPGYALVHFGTHQEAIDAVRRLDHKYFAERRLQVELAQETTTISNDTRPRTSSIASSGSVVSSNAPSSPSERRQRRGPIIADGSV